MSPANGRRYLSFVTLALLRSLADHPRFGVSTLIVWLSSRSRVCALWVSTRFGRLYAAGVSTPFSVGFLAVRLYVLGFYPWHVYAVIVFWVFLHRCWLSSHRRAGRLYTDGAVFVWLRVSTRLWGFRIWTTNVLLGLCRQAVAGGFVGKCRLELRLLCCCRGSFDSCLRRCVDTFGFAWNGFRVV